LICCAPWQREWSVQRIEQEENKLRTIHTQGGVGSCTAWLRRMNPLTSHLTWCQSRSGYPSAKLSFDILASLFRPARFLTAAQSSTMLATMFFRDVFYHRSQDSEVDLDLCSTCTQYLQRHKIAELKQGSPSVQLLSQHIFKICLPTLLIVLRKE